MGRSVLSPTQLSVEMMSPMPFIVILLVIGSINAMPNPTSDIKTGEDVIPLTTNTPDTRVTVGNDNMDNHYEAGPQKRDKRTPQCKRPSYCTFKTGCGRKGCDMSKCSYPYC